MTKCFKCDNKVSQEARFCTHCGTSMALIGPGETAGPGASIVAVAGSKRGGRIELLHDRLHIRPRRGGSDMHEQDVPLSRIRSVTFRPASMTSNGYMGVSVERAPSEDGGPVADYDVGVVVFSENDKFAALKDALENRLAAVGMKRLDSTEFPLEVTRSESCATPVGVEENGSIAVIDGQVVHRTHGKHALSRKEWQKEDVVPISSVATVLVESRDRQEFNLTVLDASGSSLMQVKERLSKADIDRFLRDLAEAAPHVHLLLAHPSHGLTDPAVGHAKKAAEEAKKYNRTELKNRQQAAAGQVQVKNYANFKDYQRDAPKMARAGWSPQGQIGGSNKVSVSGTVMKGVMTGGLGLVTGPSRKSDRITVTWVKGPTNREPRPLMNIPLIPEPRVFPPEPYFEATTFGPVTEGQEFPPVNTMKVDSVPSVDDIVYPRKTDVVQPVETSVQSGAVSESVRSSSIDRMQQLKELQSAGLITDSEYEAKRSEILADL
jgi:Short C-terminal domain